MDKLIHLLESKTTLKKVQIKNILMLLDKGDTIPFIARYRKELTQEASDDELRKFHDAYLLTKRFLERKDEINHILKEREQITPKLTLMIEQSATITELEDIYRPYKEKKNTRASLAIKRGLSQLSKILLESKLSREFFVLEAKNFVRGEIEDTTMAIDGAKDILAESYADNKREREALRSNILKYGKIEVKATKTFNENGVYKIYKQHIQKISYITSHQYLAIKRGEKEKELNVKLTIDSDRYLDIVKKYSIKTWMESSKSYLFDAYKDGFKRLLYPSIEREVFAILKLNADKEAISVFGKNLTQLFMTAPVVGKVLLGVDPAFRTGCKLAVIDENGNYIDHEVIYPTAPKNDYSGAKKVVEKLTKLYGIQGAVIGNGTASNETQAFFSKLNDDGVIIPYTVVSEAGASVYSASSIASEEYPDLDVSIRGAISIAGRVRDPMGTLVKINPKSLGIGQYQHDVDQKLLERKLYDGVESIVNSVGVDLNSASAYLLSFVSGLGLKSAKNIVEYREKYGVFKSKSELLNVKGVGAKAYEQSAGFLRIRDGKSIFDNTAIHPENYAVAKKLETIKDVDNLKEIAISLDVSKLTIVDILNELKKPGFDPRDDLPPIPFKESLTDISSLLEGSIVSGIVRNIVDFGVFVDIGLKNDGMIHISQLSHKKIVHPLDMMSINQYLPRIEVVKIDLNSGKVSLSLKDI